METRHGIHAVVYALFDGQERLDRAAMRRQVELCLQAGVHGMVTLGLASEAAKLSEAERRTLMEWVAEDTAGRVPLGVTISGASAAEQVALVRAAESVKADWVILQPPMVGTYSAAEYIRFFGRVADTAGIPVAIQNAPAYMGRGLSVEDLTELVGQHPNVRLLKGEGPACDIRQFVEQSGLPVFNGRGGLEFTDNLRAGCAGLILAPELIDHAVRAYELFRGGDQLAAELGYAAMLPAIVFVMQSLESMICYGKRLFGARADLIVHDRAPAMRPSEFGLDIVRRLAGKHGKFAA